MTFTINGLEIQKDKLYAWAREEGMHSDLLWVNEIALSIMSWMDTSEFVEIKTSGSTGAPKLIRHSKKEMMASAIKTGERFQLKEGMTTLHCLPSKFIAGKMMLIRALVLNLNQICIEPKLALHFEKHAVIDFAAMTPMQLDATLESYPNTIQKIEKLIIGGGPIMPALMEKIQQLKTRCFATYGMTETITHIATVEVNGINSSDVYETLRGVTVSEKDKNLVIVADHIDQSPIITTDQVEILNDRQFRWLGRNDHIINSGGIKIHPVEVEKKLAHLLTCRFIVSGAHSEQSGEQAVLIIESKPFDRNDLLALERELKKNFKLLRQGNIYFVPKLFETPNGKIRRNINLYIPEST